jgi:hypothetical protein
MTPATDETCCPIVELRQYTLHPGMRDVLIDLFDREFVESQEALGMRVVGQFRDLDDANRFVWLRGFRDMPSRGRGLADFYGGPVWKAHREAANATMIDSDNVLLLRRARPTSGFLVEHRDRPPPGAGEAPKGLVMATVYDFDAPPGADFLDFFERALRPVVTGAGASILAYFVTENSANNYPALPVREGEQVFVWFSLFPEEAAYEYHAAALARSRRWSEVAESLARRVKGPPEVLKLSPTARSLVRA